jgi:hypothetical protein
MRHFVYESSGSHRGVTEVSSFLECDFLSLGGQLTTLRRIIVSGTAFPMTMCHVPDDLRVHLF